MFSALGSRSFYAAASCLWNSLPAQPRSQSFFPKEMGRAGKRPGPFCRPSHFLREKSLGMRLVVASEILNPERLKKIKGNRQTWTSRLQFRLYFILFFCFNVACTHKSSQKLNPVWQS